MLAEVAFVGIGAVALEEQFAFFVHCDDDFVFTRIAFDLANRLVFTNQINVPYIAAFVVVASALDGLVVGVLGIGEVIDELRGEPEHVGAMVSECPRGDQ